MVQLTVFNGSVAPGFESGVLEVTRGVEGEGVTATAYLYPGVMGGGLENPVPVIVGAAGIREVRQAVNDAALILAAHNLALAHVDEVDGQELVRPVKVGGDEEGSNWWE